MGNFIRNAILRIMLRIFRLPHFTLEATELFIDIDVKQVYLIMLLVISVLIIIVPAYNVSPQPSRVPRQARYHLPPPGERGRDRCG